MLKIVPCINHRSHVFDKVSDGYMSYIIYWWFSEEN